VARALVPGLRLGNAAFVVLDVAPLLVPAATA